jgi:cytochrome c oxidase cbb3-type subunit 3
MMILKTAALAVFGASMMFAQSAVEAGQQVYRANCFACHGPDGDQINGVAFKTGVFRHASTDDDLAGIIEHGIPGTGMPPTSMSAESRRALVAYLRSMHSTGGAASVSGDAAHGKVIFEGKGGCTGCHRVDEHGSHTGPDLSEIGSRPAPYLEKSILDPNDTVAPQNRYVHIVTRQGVTINGRRLNEDTHTILLIDTNEKLVSLDKSQLRELTVMQASAMPSYQGKLSSQEVADLVAYLVSLRGGR